MGQRYHFLDGLRGVAMLLGILLHAAISFLGVPVWPVTDVKADPESFHLLLDAIHGFRMQLFFLVSGFFTVMVWQKRGTKRLVKQRLLRIGVPLVIGVILLNPMMGFLMKWGGEVNVARVETAEAAKGGLNGAIIKGDVVKVKSLLSEGGDANEVGPDGSPMLHGAALYGNAEIVRVLVEAGAEIDAQSTDGGTALITAAFFGRLDVVEVLLELGADVNVENGQGTTALEAAEVDFAIVKLVGGGLGVQTDEEMKEDRELVVEVLKSGGGEAKERGLKDLYWMGVFWPVLHHLWFLYYLLWLLLFFVPLAMIFRKIRWRLPQWMIATPWCLFWVVPLTFWLQTLIQMPEIFGPGTATGILPWGAKLAYYAIFFFFGALCYGRGWWEEKAGCYWWAWFLMAVPLLLVGRTYIDGDLPLVSQACAALYAWVVIIGMMGAFRRFLNGESKKVRYLSDSSYWLYLAHMPPLIAVQILLSGWDFSAWGKFWIMSIGVTGLLLVIYELVIRYTWIGAILNGRRYRASSKAEVSQKE